MSREIERCRAIAIGGFGGAKHKEWAVRARVSLSGGGHSVISDSVTLRRRLRGDSVFGDAGSVITWTLSKPALKLVIKGGGRGVEIQWTKGKADSIYIEHDKGNGWQFLAVDTVPHYIDNTPVTGPATWKYRAIYLINDERVGDWSDTMNITVG